MKAIPMERKQANEFVEQIHRHHAPSCGDKYRIGAQKDGKLVGVVQVGRPVARGLDNGRNVEVLRLCTDGTRNACSFLLGRAARIAKEMGYTKIYTYTLAGECGVTLRAAGWTEEAQVRGRHWNTPSRPRQTTAPTCDKKRWSKNLNKDEEETP